MTLPGRAPARHVRLARAVPLRRRAARSSTAAHARRVRRLQRAGRARERRPCSSCSRSGTSSSTARILLDRLERRARAGARAGRRPRGARAGDDARGRASSCANVGFRYGGPSRRRSSRGSTSTSRPGATVAIVGRSGSGKTTLVKLPRRPARADRGHDPLDGVDLRTLDYRTLRRQIGFVLQENYLFDDTIARNIAFGEGARPGARRLGGAASPTRTSSSSACRSATRRGSARAGCGSRAGSSSASRSPARVYHRPPVLLFDEATSALDTESERAVKENLDELLARPDVVRDRAPAEHDPRRRRDRRARARARSSSRARTTS